MGTLKSKRKDLIADIIRQRVISGYFRSKKLPPLKEFAEEFNVSIYTMQTVMDKLAKEGLLRMRQGDGTYLEDYITPIQSYELVPCYFHTHPFLGPLQELFIDCLGRYFLAPIICSIQGPHLIQKIVHGELGNLLVCAPPSISTDFFMAPRLRHVPPVVLGFDFWHLPGIYHQVMVSWRSCLEHIYTVFQSRESNSSVAYLFLGNSHTIQNGSFEQGVYLHLFEELREYTSKEKIPKYVLDIQNLKAEYEYLLSLPHRWILLVPDFETMNFFLEGVGSPFHEKISSVGFLFAQDKFHHQFSSFYFQFPTQEVVQSTCELLQRHRGKVYRKDPPLETIITDMKWQLG